jgi:methyl-accepting chemotaxis protein
MKIGVKLVAIISTFNLIGIGLLASVTITFAQRETRRLVDAQAVSLAVEGSEKIKNWFGRYMDTVRTLAQVMEGYKSIPAAERRDRFNFMMRQVILANPELQTIWTNWGPNLIDGMDAEYANTPGTDETGRYMPGFVLDSDGLRVAAIDGFDWDTVMQYNITTDFVFDPTAYLIGEDNVLLANISSPIKDNGAVVGYIGVTFVLSRVQAIADEIKPFGDGSALVFSNGGIVSAHPDNGRLGKDMRESEADTFGPMLDTLVKAVTTGTAVAFSSRSPQSDAVINYYTAPFTVGQSPLPWTLVVGISHNAIMAPVYRMIIISAVIGLLIMIVMSVGVIFTARSISRPIAYTMTALKDISEGNLTRQVDVKSKDELGDLARYLNFTIDKIRDLVLSIKKEAGILSGTGTELASNVTQTAVSINQITTNIQSIRSRTGEQSRSVKSTNSIMGQVVKNIDTLNVQVQKQTDCVSQSSSAIEQMLANIQSVTRTLIKNVENVNGLADASEIGHSGLQEVSADIQEIARESEGLLEINSVMENIASQTNLLSMNAAIEAAHAGEAGKGFAVVADEIRKLAESSGEQSKTISAVLKKIKDSIDNITKSTDAVLLKFEAIGKGVQTVTDQETNIRNAMEEQGTGSKNILEAIGSLNEITGEVKNDAQVMFQGSGQVIRESKTLEDITAEITSGMNEMAAGADRISGAVNRVNDISINNKKQIDVLINEVSRFKVE